MRVFLFFIFLNLLLFQEIKTMPKPKCKPKQNASPTAAFNNLVEGDIAVGGFPDVINDSGQVSQAFVNMTERLWLGGIIPFAFKEFQFVDEVSGKMVTEPLFSTEYKNLIKRALQHVMNHVPCLIFR